ncbi:hypothetical protein [Rice orange leaf phytoplasma]|nr:hypothetical protein [Rice orange leaf phytoplasma]
MYFLSAASAASKTSGKNTLPQKLPTAFLVLFFKVVLAIACPTF